MTDSPGDFSNPYASPEPLGRETAEVAAVVTSALPLTREIYIATIMVWCASSILGIASGYVLIAWLDQAFAWQLQINPGGDLPRFAAGAANGLVMSALLACGQYYAVFRRDAIWTRIIGLWLLIASAVIALSAVLMFPGTLVMWLMFLPAVISLILSLLMFRWYSLLWAFKRSQRRRSVA